MALFQRAERKRVTLKLAITGPSGSGKTYSALKLAFGLGSKVAVLDTENGSASLYAHLGEYDTAILEPPFSVAKYLSVIQEAQKAGYEVLVIDSLTHEWAGEGGLLDQKTAKDARGGNQFSNWADVSKEHERLKSNILQSPMHIICTMRSKQEYVQEKNEKGVLAVRKVGMAPIQREGMEYEFTTVFDLDMSHTAQTSKDRTGLFDGEIFQISEATGQKLKAWMMTGAEVPSADPLKDRKTAAFTAWKSKEYSNDALETVLGRPLTTTDDGTPHKGKTFQSLTFDELKKVEAALRQTNAAATVPTKAEALYAPGADGESHYEETAESQPDGETPALMVVVGGSNLGAFGVTQ